MLILSSRQNPQSSPNQPQPTKQLQAMTKNYSGFVNDYLFCRLAHNDTEAKTGSHTVELQRLEHLRDNENNIILIFFNMKVY